MNSSKKIFALIFLLNGLLFAQHKEYIRLFQEGNNFLEDEDYADALECFLKAYKYDSLNANINFKIGCCYAELPEHKEYGEKYFERAIKDITKKYKEQNPKQKHAPYFAYFYYAELLHNENKLEESKKMFKAYEKFLNSKKEKNDSILLAHYEEMVETAREKESHPDKINILNLGDSINSKEAEYTPLCDANESILIFTYSGAKCVGADEGLKTESGKYFEDIYFSNKMPDGSWSKAKPINGLNTKGNEACVSISHDGNTLIIYKDDDGDGNLYYTERSGENWGELKKFGDQIDSKYWEPSASFSTDLNTLYFVSDRPGGFGGRDIYSSKKLPNGNWSKPKNLGPKINTIYDEESPYLHINGKDFYFSSTGHKSMGGFDIMKSEIQENETFGEVTCLPYPLNTTGDDLFYFISSDNKRAYYSSAHHDTSGKADLDIYVIKLKDSTTEVGYFARGEFINEDKGSAKPLSVEVFNSKDNSLLGIYKPNSNGNFITYLPADTNLKIVYFNGKDTIRKQSVFYKKTDTLFSRGNEFQLEKVMILKPKIDVLIKDKDKDGVADSSDACVDVLGPIENRGCPWPDSDLDGLIDIKDSCPDIAGVIENKGCPKIKEEEIKIIEKAFSDLEFENGKDIILKSSHNSLNELAALMKVHEKDWKVKLAGHTDNQGKPANNLKLSEKRAKAVMKYLIGKGALSKNIIVEWYGQTKPVADNLTEEGRQKNRRVNISVINGPNK
ncbi:MAG: OmpA family protein [Bacteroidota bacterium]